MNPCPVETRSRAGRGDALIAFHAPWIRYDSEALAPEVGVAALAFMKSDPSLSLCHDVAIGSKHLRVNHPLTDADPQLVRDQKLWFTLAGPEVPPLVSVRFSVQTDTGRMDAFELATACVSAWDQFFKDNGL